MRRFVFLLAFVAAACGDKGGNSTSPTGNNGNGGSLQNGRIPLAAASCGTATALLTVPPIPLNSITGWIPLGQMAPSGHTFPTDHQYLYINGTPGQTVYKNPVLVAPADMYVTYIHAGTTTPPGLADYSIEFALCKEVYGQFGHVNSISPSLLALVGPLDQQCTTYSPNAGTTVQTCQTKLVAVLVHAGDVLGSAGGDPPHSIALDFWFWDGRVPAAVFANPARFPMNNDLFDAYHIVGANEYFAEPLKTTIAGMMGTFDGSTHRTMLPLGGTIAVDIAGTAMGHWYSPGLPLSPETPHLAIAPDNVVANRVGFSIGQSNPGWTRGLVEFTPLSSGNVNRNPAQVTADGNIYCYESPNDWILLMKMPSATALQLEGRVGTVSCAAAQPWTFTAGASFTYSR